jgi:hypothetical protein
MPIARPYAAKRRCLPVCFPKSKDEDTLDCDVTYFNSNLVERFAFLLRIRDIASSHLGPEITFS